MALAAQTLEPVRSQLMRLFDVPGDFSDEGVGEFGLHNSVMAMGDTFFEIVAPTQADTAVERSLEKARAPVCGYMALFQVDDFQTFDRHIDELGLRKVWSVDRERVSACHLHPKDIGGAIVSFDEMRPPADWVWAGPDWRQQRAEAQVVGIGLAAPDPEALAKNWASVTQTSARLAGDEYRIDYDDDTYATFGAGERPGVVRFDIEVPDREGVMERARQLELDSTDGVRLGALSLRVLESALSQS